MQCPKCRFESDAQTTECRRCGIVFAKFVRVPAVESPAVVVVDDVTETLAARREFIAKCAAVPCALLVARILVAVAPGTVRLLSMWVHEFGHAVTAWLCGFSAMPGPWFTPVGLERSRGVSMLLTGALLFGGFMAWQRRRWFWVIAAAAVVLVQLKLTWAIYSDQAMQLIYFGGDGGCFVLGSVLMATFYARKEHAFVQNGLRWGFLVIGALSFMDAFATWTGGLQNVPLGENENGLSDPSVLTELYGWNLHVLIARNSQLAVFCLIALIPAYVAGLVQAFRLAFPERFAAIETSLKA
jgi:hypothetical protein